MLVAFLMKPPIGQLPQEVAHSAFAHFDTVEQNDKMSYFSILCYSFIIKIQTLAIEIRVLVNLR